MFFTRDVHDNENLIMATYADDTALLVVEVKIELEANKVSHKVKRWRNKIKETKYKYISFTSRTVVHLKDKQVLPYANNRKYIGMKCLRKKNIK